ncbi:MAG: methyltransferase family protein [Leptospirales bacterium]
MDSSFKKILPFLAEQIYRRRVYLYITIFLILWPLNTDNPPPVLVRFQLSEEMPQSFLKIIAIMCSILYMIAVFIRMLGTEYIGRSTVWSSVMKKETLCYDGPYRYLRHPVYAGSLLILFSLAPMCSPYGAVFLILFGGGLTLFLARYEELILGDQKKQYKYHMASIPRFIPRRGFLKFFIQRIPSTLKNWRITITSERYNMAFGIGFFCFTVSFQKNAFWVGFIVSLVILWGITFLGEKYQKPP